MNGAGTGFGSRGGGGNWPMRELAKDEHFDWPIIQRALGSFIPYWRPALLVGWMLVLTSAGGTVPAWLTQRLIDVGILKSNLNIVSWLTVALIGIAIVTGLLGVLQTWLSNLIAQNIMADYRMALFRHLQKQSIRFFTKSQSGDLVSRMMNDVTAIQNVITNTLVGVLNNILVIVSTLILMFDMNWRMSVLSLLVVPGFILPTQKVGKSRQRLQGEIQKWLSNMTVHLSETFGVSGALLVRMFAREHHEESQFQTSNRTLRDLQVRQTLVGRWLFMWFGMFSSVGPAMLWGYGGWLVIHHRIGLGVIVAFTSLLGRLYGPLSQLAQLHVSVLSSIALFRRIYAILDVVPEIQGGDEEVDTSNICGKIQFCDVSFGYPAESESAVSKLVLDSIDLVVEPGQTVALVGPSGAGKTSLLNLIPRFSDPLVGQVRLDDMDVKSLTLKSLRLQMGIVPQDPFFFHDTVLNNLLLAHPEASIDDAIEACQAAQIHDTIEALPDRYDTLVGERGYRLAGGERQRLAIARVLLQAPRIVLLDEATSALDTLVERKIQAALTALMQGRTAVVIAHRLSTIKSADRIVVLNQGHIVAQGTHDSLLNDSALYRELYEAQFGVQLERSQPQ